MNLYYRFTLLIENNARISKSPPSLNAAVWGRPKMQLAPRLVSVGQISVITGLAAPHQVWARMTSMP